MTDKTVTVTKKHVSRLIQTVMHDLSRGGTIRPATAAAIKHLIDNPAGLADNPDSPVTLPVTVVWNLYSGSYAMGVYNLDETSDAAYEHPAVEAELEVFQALIEQAPEVFEQDEAALRRVVADNAMQAEQGRQ